HPCLSLTVPTTKPVTDFHRQDVTHAGRTKKKTASIATASRLENKLKMNEHLSYKKELNANKNYMKE
ncbi:TPA: hypothetical protein ACJHH5_002376, partial [Staphylococcus pseudintermedius]